MGRGLHSLTPLGRGGRVLRDKCKAERTRFVRIPAFLPRSEPMKVFRKLCRVFKFLFSMYRSSLSPQIVAVYVGQASTPLFWAKGSVADTLFTQRAVSWDIRFCHFAVGKSEQTAENEDGEDAV